MNTNIETSIYKIPETSDRLIKRSLLFVPGAYLVLLLSGLLIAFFGIIIIYILENLLSAFISTFSIHIAFVVGAGMIFGIIGVLNGLYRTIWSKLSFEMASEVNEQSEPQLFQLINRMCDEMDCERPNAVILHADQDFFVMDGRLSVVDQTVSGRILCISLPMLNFLSINELRSIMAHEFAHFTGWDTAYTKRILPVYSGVIAVINQVNRGLSNTNLDYGLLMAAPSVVPITMLKIYLKWFHKMNMTVSRSREQRADCIAAMTCGTISFVEALKKVASIGHIFSMEATRQLTAEYKHGRGFINYYEIFRTHVVEMRGYIQQQLESELNRVPMKDNSHPTLIERIKYLPDISEKYLDHDLAKSLLANGSEYEQKLTDEFSEFLNK